MFKPDIPFFCNPCIQRLQAICPHLHTTSWGRWHFSEGEPWDDIHELCDDCGANLDDLPNQIEPLTEAEEAQILF